MTADISLFTKISKANVSKNNYQELDVITMAVQADTTLLVHIIKHSMVVVDSYCSYKGGAA